ncbi:hypothetical protein [Streptomyces sp. NPDC006012]|uniref:hypothetical protein n=1 Tax=Streptomyces sp. NPDC006012 TaxID=3364739 RepID=UPI0036D0B350
MTVSVHRSGGDAEAEETAGIDLRRLEAGLALEPASDEEAQGHASGRKSILDLAKKVAMTNAFTLVAGGYSVGYGETSSSLKAAGFANLATYNGIKAADEWPEDRKLAAANMATAIGTGVWTASIVADSPLGQAVGAGINTVANLADAWMRYSQGKEGVGQALVDAAEMAAFVGANYTSHPVARAFAFAGTAAGFGVAAMQDKDFVGHVLGAAAWSAGAALKSNPVQAAGAGVVGGAEALRLGATILKSAKSRWWPSTASSPTPSAPPSSTAQAAASLQAVAAPLLPKPDFTPFSASSLTLQAAASATPLPDTAGSPFPSAASSPLVYAPPGPIPSTESSPDASPFGILTAPPGAFPFPPMAPDPAPPAAFNPPPPPVPGPIPSVAFGALLSPLSGPPSPVAPTATPAPVYTPSVAAMRYTPPGVATSMEQPAGVSKAASTRPSSLPAARTTPVQAPRPASSRSK